jgi:membrane protein DedA with SNARE-associated domain
MEQEPKVPKITLVAVLTIIAIVIISLTVGKDIYEGRSQNLTSFGAIHFLGYLFFILMPVEMAFIYYLSWYNEVILIGMALITAVAAQLIDYLTGIFFSSHFIMRFISERRILKAENYIERYGAMIIFLFNFLPLSSPVIALAAGILKYSMKKLLIYSIAGLLIKYLLLALIF